MTTVPLRSAAVAVGLLAAVDLAREAWFHLVSEPIWNLPAAMREVRAALGASSAVATTPGSPRSGR